MAKKQPVAIHRHVNTLFNVGTTGGLTDGQLLERFVPRNGEAAELAFAALVERHGPMVLRVCRASLRDEHEAQDAFQATFLILALRAGSIRKRESAASWLHGVARRVASCARSASARRRAHERRAAAMAGRSVDASGWDDLGEAIHEELARLPGRYREAVLVCDLEGLTEGQAAQRLDWPIGTVRSRLARGRERLRRRLMHRGLAPALGALGVTLTPGPASAAPPAALVDSTVRAATQLAMGRAAAGVVSGSVDYLMRKAMKTMLPTGLKASAAALLACGAFATAAACLAARTGPAEPPRDDPPTTEPPKAEPVRADDMPTYTVKPGKLAVTLVERGSLEASRSEDVFCEVEGITTIIRIVPEGTRVKKGQLVCELDTASLKDRLTNQVIAKKEAEAAHRNAELAHQAAQIAYAEYVGGIFKQEQEALRGAVAAAESAIREAGSRLERTRRARKRLDDVLAPKAGAVTPADILAELDLEDRLEATELTLDRERRAFERAKAQQEVLEKYTRPRMTRELEVDVKRKESDERAKRAAWELEESKETNLSRQIEKCKLYAPGDGFIVYANDPSRFGVGNHPQIEEGASVRERQLILRIPDLSLPMRVNTKVREARVDQVSRGLRARIQVDAFPNQPLTGTVESVAPLPDSSSFFNRDVKVYTTLVKVEERFPGLRPGMTAQVEIHIAELDDVLSVPVRAVLQYAGKWHVAVQKPDGGVDWREVTLGVANDEFAEVKQGIESGDRVALNPIGLMSEEEKREKLGASPEPAPAKPAPPRPQVPRGKGTGRRAPRQ